MEQIIKINCPEGKKAIYNEETHTIDFIDIEPIRSKSWKEFCENHPNANNEYTIGLCGISHADTTYKRCPKYHNQNLLATLEDAEGISALIQLTRLHDEWVGNWKFNWEDDKDIKFGIYAYNNAIDIFTLTVSHRLLVFPSFQMAKEFLECFRDLIEKAKKFL